MSELSSAESARALSGVDSLQEMTEEMLKIISGMLDLMAVASPEARAARVMQKKAYALRAEDDDEEADRLEARAEELYAAADAA
jgi:hypothetical protein